MFASGPESGFERVFKISDKLIPTEQSLTGISTGRKGSGVKKVTFQGSWRPANPLKSVYLEFCLTKLLRPTFRKKFAAFESSRGTALGLQAINLASTRMFFTPLSEIEFPGNLKVLFKQISNKKNCIDLGKWRHRRTAATSLPVSFVIMFFTFYLTACILIEICWPQSK